MQSAKLGFINAEYAGMGRLILSRKKKWQKGAWEQKMMNRNPCVLSYSLCILFVLFLYVKTFNGVNE